MKIIVGHANIQYLPKPVGSAPRAVGTYVVSVESVKKDAKKEAMVMKDIPA